MPKLNFRNSHGQFVDISAVAATKVKMEFDELLAYMQTASARKGVKAAFTASPIELGHAAVKAANRCTPRKRARRVSTAART